MEAVDKKKLIAIVLIFIAFLVGIVIVFANVITGTVQKNIEGAMQEIASHDKVSIENTNETRWTDLELISNRVKESEPQDVQELCARLNMEGTNKIYSKLVLVDDQGMTYTSSGGVSDGRDLDPVKRILWGEKKFAVLFRTGNVIERYIDTLTYGISITPMEVAGKKIVGIYAITDYYSMEKQLKVTSFDGQGSTFIFDDKGYYIVHKKAQANVADRENFYESLKNDYLLPYDDVKEIKENLRYNKSFANQYTDTQGNKIFIYYTNIKNTDWTMALEVPYDAIKKTTTGFVSRTLIMAFLIILALMILMWFSLRSFLTASKAVAEAKARSEFLSTMSHEIRTPLNGIIGLNHLMQSNVDDKEKLDSYLKKSASAEEYLMTLLNDILDVQKLQAGKVDINNEEFSLNTLVNTMETIIRPRMEEKDIDFRITTKINEDSLIGDATRIQQIVMNILSNASKFTDTNGLVEMRIYQGVRADGRINTTYEIEDNGCGMTEEFRKHIFDAFSQERNAITNSIKGTGLGMNISHLLATAMGGSLTVTSQMNKGSCFKLVLTNEISEQDGKGRAGHHEGTDRKGNRHLNILVAEDNELNAEILMELLQEFGHSADIATDGEEVINVFRNSDEGFYDLILMDIQMPVRNGYEATEIIRKMDRSDAGSVLIFACTANTFKEDVEKAKEAGMNDFIGKPIDVQKLMDKLNDGACGGF